MNELLEKPCHKTIEISVFGGGNAFGESILLHLGYDYWVLVDSCINPGTKKNLALGYLESLYSTTADKIKIIVATHWHDDHIKGLSEVLENSTSCEKLVVSSALSSEEFISLTSLSNDIRFSRSGSLEFNKIFKIARTRKSTLKVKLSKQDTTLKILNANDINVELIALSPSDTSVVKTIRNFAEEFRKVSINPNFVFSKTAENHNSVVLLLNINNDTIILGGDLEVLADTDLGWNAVLQSEKIQNTQSIILKVPHHGSNTAYSKQLWDGFLQKNLYALLTPWKRGHRSLPTKANKDTILSHTSNSFITSEIPKVKIRKRDTQITKIVNELDINLTQIPFEYGQIRMRKKIDALDWQVDLYGGAIDFNSFNPI